MNLRKLTINTDKIWRWISNFFQQPHIQKQMSESQEDQKMRSLYLSVLKYRATQTPGN